MSVCLSPLTFFAIYSKNLQATYTLKCVTLLNIFLRMPLPQHFWDTQYKMIFWFNQKIFLQALVEKFFDVNFFGTPWDPPTNKLIFFTYKVLGIKIWRNFWKIFKKKDFHSTFGTPSTTYFFCFNFKKSFYNP